MKADIQKCVREGVTEVRNDLELLCDLMADSEEILVRDTPIVIRLNELIDTMRLLEKDALALGDTPPPANNPK